MWWSTSVGLISIRFLFRISGELIEYYHLLSDECPPESCLRASDFVNAGFIGNFRNHFAEYSIHLCMVTCLEFRLKIIQKRRQQGLSSTSIRPTRNHFRDSCIGI